MARNLRAAKKPTISSSFYDSYTTKPVKWYEIVDSYRQKQDTYVPLRLENFPTDLWENFKAFFRSDEPTEEIDDEDPVHEVKQTRADGNIIQVTEYDLTKDTYDPRISGAVRQHEEKVDRNGRRLQSRFEPDRSVRSPSSPVLHERHRHRRHRNRTSPSELDDCAECRALAAQGYPTMCNCDQCRAKRAAYPNETPYCNCPECRNTKRA